MELHSLRKYSAAQRYSVGFLAASMMLGPLTGCASEHTATVPTISTSAEAMTTIDISKQYIAQIVEPISGHEPISEESLENISKAYSYLAAKFPGFSDQSSIDSLIKLWWKESRWLMDAKNNSSGAYGIPQMNPTSGHDDVPADYYTDLESQIHWGITYITKRYGTPTDAWQHSEELGWY